MFGSDGGSDFGRCAPREGPSQIGRSERKPMYRNKNHDFPKQTSYCIRLYVVMTVTIIAGCGYVAFGQSAGTGKTINLEPLRPTMPVVLGSVRVDGSRIVPGVQFHASPDWLEHLHVVVFNRTIKPIIAITIELSFPETGDGGYPSTGMWTYQVQVGNIPAYELVDPSGKKLKQTLHTAIDLLPGASIDVDLGKPEYSRMVSTLVRGRAPRICHIRALIVTFSDGTMWGVDSFMRPDPMHPGRYRQLSPDEFFK